MPSVSACSGFRVPVLARSEVRSGREKSRLRTRPTAFTAVLNALAIRPDTTIFVDDSPANIDGGDGTRHAESSLATPRRMLWLASKSS